MTDSIAIEGTDDNQILPKFLSKVVTICFILSRPIMFCVTFTAINKLKRDFDLQVRYLYFQIHLKYLSTVTS